MSDIEMITVQQAKMLGARLTVLPEAAQVGIGTGLKFITDEDTAKMSLQDLQIKMFTRALDWDQVSDFECAITREEERLGLKKSNVILININRHARRKQNKVNRKSR